MNDTVSPGGRRRKKKRPDLKWEPYKGMPFPESLLNDIGLELVYEDRIYVPLTEDQMAGLNAVLETLSERERQLVCWRYKEHLTLEVIGNKVGLSRERVRQILDKAVQKLRYPANLILYKEGLEAHQYRIERANGVKVVITPDMSREEIREILSGKNGLSIYEIGLRIRTVNCLKRAGIETLSQLVEMMYFDPPRFVSIHNLGVTSLKEILEMAEKRCIAIPEVYKTMPL